MIKVNGELYVRETYPDGTKKMQGKFFLPEANNPNGDTVVEWLYDGEDELVDLMYLASHLKALGISYVLFMPYIPNARNDRVHDAFREVFTLKHFSGILNGLGFKNIAVLDPHSHVSEALIDNVYVMQELLRSLIELVKHSVCTLTGTDTLTLCYPDEGAMKRYSDLVSNPYVFGIKKRDWETGKILGLDIMGDPALIEGKNILIVDDICSKGGTFYYTAKKLKELGASRVFLYVTHCENTIFDGELLKDNGLIDRIFTTDSIFRGEHEKIEVFKL